LEAANKSLPRKSPKAESTIIDEKHTSSTAIQADPLSITAPTVSEVSLGTPADGLQTVTVTISKSLANPGGKLFGRLSVRQPEWLLFFRRKSLVRVIAENPTL
jgi:hypothetical protein